MTGQPAPLENVSPSPGQRFSDSSNEFGLLGGDHYALPTHNIVLLERFLREMLGGVPYYYAGFDETDQKMGRPPHIFVRVGNVLVQCTEEPGETNTAPSDQRIAPHWAFHTSSEGLDRNRARLEQAGIPVAGPYRHRGVECVSIYFRAPEGHKLEIVTWEPYPEERAQVLGAPGVGFIDWSKLVHSWPERAPSLAPQTRNPAEAT
ncbi:MAG: VOC family protein [Bradyrhizobium sp.]|nr:VOC family protein [Bradyrhizobium sp.]